MENWFFYLENIYIVLGLILGPTFARFSVNVCGDSEEREALRWLLFPFTEWNYQYNNGPAVGTAEAIDLYSYMFFDGDVLDLSRGRHDPKVFVYYALFSGLCWLPRVLWIILFLFVAIFVVGLLEILSKEATDGFKKLCEAVQKIWKETPDP